MKSDPLLQLANKGKNKKVLYYKKIIVLLHLWLLVKRKSLEKKKWVRRVNLEKRKILEKR